MDRAAKLSFVHIHRDVYSYLAGRSRAKLDASELDYSEKLKVTPVLVNCSHLAKVRPLGGRGESKTRGSCCHPCVAWLCFAREPVVMVT